MNKQKVQWSVSLSNGETLYENKGNFQTIEGELSPYQRLLAFIVDEGASITSMSLYTDDGHRWNLPSAGKNPKFKAFSDAEKPVSYKFFRKLGQDVTCDGEKGEPDIYSVIEAVYDMEGKRIQVWVDNKTFNSWSLII